MMSPAEYYPFRSLYKAHDSSIKSHDNITEPMIVLREASFCLSQETSTDFTDSIRYISKASFSMFVA